MLCVLYELQGPYRGAPYSPGLGSVPSSQACAATSRQTTSTAECVACTSCALAACVAVDEVSRSLSADKHSSELPTVAGVPSCSLMPLVCADNTVEVHQRHSSHNARLYEPPTLQYLGLCMLLAPPPAVEQAGSGICGAVWYRELLTTGCGLTVLSCGACFLSCGGIATLTSVQLAALRSLLP